MAWDKLDLSGVRMEKPSFFVQTLAKKLRLNPTLEDEGVRLTGKTIPLRLWLAFSETPFVSAPYHKVYNGVADKNLFSGKIALIGPSMSDTGFFRVPFSPTDFTPDASKDSYGMPGVFLFANAINRIINGYFHIDINDEWSWPTGSKRLPAVNLESLLFLLVETIITCILMSIVYVLAYRKGNKKFTYSLMGAATILFLMVLAITPVFFGLANFLCASLFFIVMVHRFRSSKTEN